MKLLSIHWGLSLGGVAKYVAMLEGVRKYISIDLRSVCILPRGRICDEQSLMRLNAVTIPVSSVLDLSWVGKVAGIMRSETPDCLMSHGFNGHLVSMVGRRRAGLDVPMLASYHGSYHATTLARKILEPVYNGFTNYFIRRHAAASVAVAQHCADYLISRRVDPGKVTVVHNGIEDLVVDPQARPAIRREWGFAPDDLVIGVASRLDPVKGIEYLIDAFATVAGRHPRARLVLMGEGSVRSGLEASAGSLIAAGRVHFAGMRSDIPQCLSAIDVFALPSLAEYHSIGLLEAMRAGCAIVATDVGGNTESVRHEKEGLIVSAADVPGLAAALDAMLVDPVLRERLGGAARRRFVEEFTSEHTLRETAKWLQRVCAGRQIIPE